MKPSNYIILGVIGLLSWVAYHNAQSVKASIGQEIGKGGFDRFQEKTKVSDKTLAEGGEVFTDVVAALKKNRTHEVAAGPDLQGQIDQLGKDHDALMARVAALEARKECVCPPVVASPAAPPVAVGNEPMVYRCENGVCNLIPASQVVTAQQQGCANGSCGTGRRRGRWKN